MERKKDELFPESTDFIIKNPTITSDLIPNHLLNNWIVLDIESDFSSQLEVFMFAYGAHKSRKTGNPSITLEAEEVNDIFWKFQSLLILESLRRRFFLDYSKVKIFDFDTYGEKIKINLKETDIHEIQDLANKFNKIELSKI